MFCSNCGQEILNEKAVVCVQCGSALKKQLFNDLLEDDRKDWLVTLLLAIFLGTLGIHRFYTKHIAIGIVQVLTLGGCGIWALIDIILIATNKFKDADGNYLYEK